MVSLDQLTLSKLCNLNRHQQEKEQQNFFTIGIFILAGAANPQEKDFHRIINCSVGELQLVSGMRQEIFKELCYQDTAACPYQECCVMNQLSCQVLRLTQINLRPVCSFRAICQTDGWDGMVITCHRFNQIFL